ncbi:MAG TPA: hypothetical protein VEI02_03160 [Planctomycetota bacterium]|nr:hypothetical protein [Planctomycetota bacterium]
MNRGRAAVVLGDMLRAAPRRRFSTAARRAIVLAGALLWLAAIAAQFDPSSAPRRAASDARTVPDDERVVFIAALENEPQPDDVETSPVPTPPIPETQPRVVDPFAVELPPEEADADCRYFKEYRPPDGAELSDILGVEIADERGVPIDTFVALLNADAPLRRHGCVSGHRWTDVRSDASLTIRLPLGARSAARLAVIASGHVPALAALPADGNVLRVTLRRASRVRGRAAGLPPELLPKRRRGRAVDVAFRLDPAPPGEVPATDADGAPWTSSLRVDGVFDFPRIPAGRWNLVVIVGQGAAASERVAVKSVEAPAGGEADDTRLAAVDLSDVRCTSIEVIAADGGPAHVDAQIRPAGGDWSSSWRHVSERTLGFGHAAPVDVLFRSPTHRTVVAEHVDGGERRLRAEPRTPLRLRFTRVAPSFPFPWKLRLIAAPGAPRWNGLPPDPALEREVHNGDRGAVFLLDDPGPHVVRLIAYDRRDPDVALELARIATADVDTLAGAAVEFPMPEGDPVREKLRRLTGDDRR